MAETKDDTSPPDVTPVWLDCDPGHDDAMALILAAYHPSLQLIGVSTVHGNVDVDRTTRNALQTLYLSGVTGVDVVKGAGKPLIRASVVCPEIHGECGLGGHDLPDLPPHIKPVDGPAVSVMFDSITNACSSSGSKVTLIATGCLTNVALLLSVYPQVSESLSSIHLMGGAIGAGNTHPVCEFNIQIDPEAAKIVFSAGIPVSMVPLEVTHTALVTKAVLDRIDELGTPFSRVVHNWLLFFGDTYNTVFGMPDPPLHDPCAVALVVSPDMFKTKLCHVDIETGSDLTAGQTVVDLINIRRREDEKNATVALTVDVDAFWDMMLAAIRQANDKSPMNE